MNCQQRQWVLWCRHERWHFVWNVVHNALYHDSEVRQQRNIPTTINIVCRAERAIWEAFEDKENSSTRYAFALKFYLKIILHHKSLPFTFNGNFVRERKKIDQINVYNLFQARFLLSMKLFLFTFLPRSSRFRHTMTMTFNCLSQPIEIECHTWGNWNWRIRFFYHIEETIKQQRSSSDGKLNHQAVFEKSKPTRAVDLIMRENTSFWIILQCLTLLRH